MRELLNLYFDDHRIIPTKDYIKHRQDHFAHKNEDFSFLEKYQTLAVVCLSYPKDQVKLGGKGFGIVARYAYGEDYHTTFKRRFAVLKEEALNEGFHIEGKADVSPIEERQQGLISWLGYMGYNDLLIHPDFGTYMMLGTVFIEEALDPYTLKIDDDCGECRLCIDACPGGALSVDGYSEHQCLSFQNQMKLPFTLEEVKPFKAMIFGCDICQRVCPKNKALQSKNPVEFQPDGNERIELAELLKLSNRAVQKKYQHYAFSYRGGLLLKRNAIMLMYNQRLYQHLDLIKKTYEEYRHVDWFEKTVRLIIEDMEAPREPRRAIPA
jgi:epoxyqueuosine reductase